MTSSTGHPKNNWFKTNNVIHGDAEIITIHTLFYFELWGRECAMHFRPRCVYGLYTRLVWMFDVVGEDCV